MNKRNDLNVDFNGVVMTRSIITPNVDNMPLFRQELGRVLRDIRKSKKMTLRDVSQKAMVSLGYLSEVERGQKEASSELLASICVAMNISLSMVLRKIASNLDAYMISHLDFSIPVQVVK